MRTLSLALVLIAGCGGDTTSTPSPAAAPKTEAAPVAAPQPAEEPKAAADPMADYMALASDADKHAFLMKMGEQVFTSSTLACQTCHQANGEGTPGAFPPLKGQKDHMGDCANHAGIVLNGLSGEIVVNDVKYNGVMTPQATMLNDLQIAAVMTYERNSWGNDFGDCTPDQVKAVRK